MDRHRHSNTLLLVLWMMMHIYIYIYIYILVLMKYCVRHAYGDNGTCPILLPSITLFCNDVTDEA